MSFISKIIFSDCVFYMEITKKICLVIKYLFFSQLRTILTTKAIKSTVISNIWISRPLVSRLNLFSKYLLVKVVISGALIGQSRIRIFDLSKILLIRWFELVRTHGVTQGHLGSNYLTQIRTWFYTKEELCEDFN